MNGLTFENAFCSACTCSPTRATLPPGYFAAQHGVKYTLEEEMPDDQFPQVEQSPHFKNVASVMAAAGCSVVHKGKWHPSKPAGDQFEPSTVDQSTELAGDGLSRRSPAHARQPS
jgi:choline-sulfatase